MESLKLGAMFQSLEPKPVHVPRTAVIRDPVGDSPLSADDYLPPPGVVYPGRFEIVECYGGNFCMRNKTRTWQSVPESVKKEILVWADPKRMSGMTFRPWAGRGPRIFAVANHTARLFAKVVWDGKNQTVRIGRVSFKSRDLIRKEYAGA